MLTPAQAQAAQAIHNEHRSKGHVYAAQAILALETQGYTATRDLIAVLAAAAHEGFPQYNGHWTGEEWKLVRVPREIKTKAGLQFAAGDLALARMDPYADSAAFGGDGVQIYSLRTASLVLVRCGHVRWLPEA